MTGSSIAAMGCLTVVVVFMRQCLAFKENDVRFYKTFFVHQDERVINQYLIFRANECREEEEATVEIR